MMPIDITSERVISVAKASRLTPSCRGDEPCHPSRLIRAIQRGELEGLKFGPRGWCTSIEALQRWGERMAAGTQPAPATVRTTKQRARAIAAAEADLDRRRVGVD
jgi:hypothetical protein